MYKIKGFLHLLVNYFGFFNLYAYRFTLFLKIVQLNVMTAEKENKPNSKKDAIYIVIILLLLLGGGYLGWQLGNAKKQNAICSENVQTLEGEKDYLNNLLKSTGIIDDADNANLEENLNNMLAEYNSLEANNIDMQDSINAQKQKITDLLAEVEQMKNQKKKDWGKIYKLKKEAETLRKIMKGYIHTIDSLNTLNIELQHTITQKDNQITQVTKENENLENKFNQSQETIKLGKVLQTSGMTAVAIKVKSSGKQTETTRASRATMIKSCFTILENKIADAGNKTIQMRIIAPSGKELTNSTPVQFAQANGTTGIASVQRQVNYQNQNVDLCVYFDLEEQEIPEGTYIVEVYTEGYLIGKTTFALK